MAKIECGGDCTRCEFLKNGQTNPAECASIWGFMGIQKMYEKMQQMHEETIGLISNLNVNQTKTIPGIEFEAPCEIEQESEISGGVTV